MLYAKYRDGKILFSDRNQQKVVYKSLKRRICLNTQDDAFVQCVIPNEDENIPHYPFPIPYLHKGLLQQALVKLREYKTHKYRYLQDLRNEDLSLRPKRSVGKHKSEADTLRERRIFAITSLSLVMT